MNIGDFNRPHRHPVVSLLRGVGIGLLVTLGLALFSIVALLPSAVTFVVMVLMRFDPALALLVALVVGIVWAFAFD